MKVVEKWTQIEFILDHILQVPPNVLKKTKAIAKLTHDSCKALEELKKEAKKDKVPFRKLKKKPQH